MKKFVVFIGLFLASTVFANEEIPELKKENWPFDGPFGHVDKQSAQRGYQVYKEVCSACHSMNLIAFRNLEQIGFSENEVKALAAEYKITDGPNDDGDMYERPRTPSDALPAPFANENAARASNNGALPPDLSLIIKARHDGANYVHSLLTGFENPPAGFDLPQGMYYNKYFTGNKIAMAPPLQDGLVTYTDGTPATIDQMSKDVVNFLQWAAEPEMEDRKEMGLKVMLYLVTFSAIFYVAMKRIWKNIK